MTAAEHQAWSMMGLPALLVILFAWWGIESLCRVIAKWWRNRG